MPCSTPLSFQMDTVHWGASGRVDCTHSCAPLHCFRCTPSGEWADARSRGHGHLRGLIRTRLALPVLTGRCSARAPPDLVVTLGIAARRLHGSRVPGCTKTRARKSLHTDPRFEVALGRAPRESRQEVKSSSSIASTTKLRRTFCSRARSGTRRASLDTFFRGSVGGAFEQQNLRISGSTEIMDATPSPSMTRMTLRAVRWLRGRCASRPTCRAR
jgi:hypothetical protein